MDISQKHSLSKEIRFQSYDMQPPEHITYYSSSSPIGMGKNKRSNSLGYPDFFPKKETTIEDSLSPNIVKNGFIDKSPGETSSAQAQLITSLRQPNSLSALSTFMVSTLYKRAENGKITGPSNFKRPPRVTLTDPKREAWLRDLANPTLPLRRLSRSCPHGIRGALILEQCLNKRIPLGRALWLIRCIGTNELRSLKRKGTSNVSTHSSQHLWLIEWTSHVAIFLKTVVEHERGHRDICQGSQLWGSKLLYSLQLASRLYTENLIDHEEFLGRLISGLYAAKNDLLLHHLLIVKYFAKHIFISRKLSMHLVQVLQARILQIKEAKMHPEGIQRVTERLQQLLWMAPDFVTFVLAENSIRGKSVSIVSEMFSLNIAKNPNLQADKHILDSASLPFDIPRITTQCFETGGTEEETIQSICRWSITPFRAGIYRMFLAANILVYYQRERPTSCNLHDVLAKFLRMFATNRVESSENLFLMYGEFVRLKIFSYPKYMRSLIADGTITSHQSSELPNRRDSVPLIEIAVGGLSDPIRNQRNSVLSHIYDPEDLCDKGLFKFKECLKSFLFGPETILMDSLYSGTFLDDMRRLNRSHKSSLAMWITQQIQNTGFDNLSCIVFDHVQFLLGTLHEYQALRAVVVDFLKHCTTASCLRASIFCLERYLDVFLLLKDPACFSVFLAQKLQSIQFEILVEKRALSIVQKIGNHLVHIDPPFQQVLNDLNLRISEAMSNVYLTPASDIGLDLRSTKDHIDISKALAALDPSDANTVTQAFLAVMHVFVNGLQPDDTLTWTYSNIMGHVAECNRRAFDSSVSEYLVAQLTAGISSESLKSQLAFLLAHGATNLSNIINAVLDTAVIFLNSQILTPKGEGLAVQSEKMILLLQLLDLDNPLQSKLTISDFLSFRFAIFQPHDNIYAAVSRLLECIVRVEAEFEKAPRLDYEILPHSTFMELWRRSLCKLNEKQVFSEFLQHLESNNHKRVLLCLLRGLRGLCGFCTPIQQLEECLAEANEITNTTLAFEVSLIFSLAGTSEDFTIETYIQNLSKWMVNHDYHGNEITSNLSSPSKLLLFSYIEMQLISIFDTLSSKPFEEELIKRTKTLFSIIESLLCNSSLASNFEVPKLSPEFLLKLRETTSKVIVFLKELDDVCDIDKMDIDKGSAFGEDDCLQRLSVLVRCIYLFRFTKLEDPLEIKGNTHLWTAILCPALRISAVQNDRSLYKYVLEIVLHCFSDTCDEHLPNVQEHLEKALPFPHSNALMISSHPDPYTDGIYLVDSKNDKVYEMVSRPWDMIEQSQPTMSNNDGPIDLKPYNARICSKDKPLWSDDNQTFQQRTFEAEKVLRNWEFAK